MEKNEQEKDVQILGSGDLAEDLPDWASKIEALAFFLSALAYHENRGGGNTTAFEMYGEHYGSIIADYARAINKTIQKHYLTLDSLADSAIIPIERFKSVVSFLANTTRKEDLIAIDHNLDEMNKIIETSVMPFLKMYEDLKASKQRIMTRKAATHNG